MPKSPTKAPLTKSEETRARILEAALRLFREKGFDATTMRDIAAEAGMSLGSAYYYFDAKDALVMGFYEQASEVFRVKVPLAMAAHEDLSSRLRVIFTTHLEHFGPDRALLAALARHAGDPQHPLSPFSDATESIRNEAIDRFALAIAGSEYKPPKDLAPHLPRLLWLAQMGLILFWVHDRSKGQVRTKKLLDQALPMLVGLLKLAKLPLTGSLRKSMVNLLNTALEPEKA